MENKISRDSQLINISYEAHITKEEELPFIFHRDTIRKRAFDIANWHRNIEILYFTDGAGTVFCDTNSYNAVPGDVIVINSNSIHYVKSESIVKFYCLIIDADFCKTNGILTDDIMFVNHISDEETAEKYMDVVNEFATRCAYYNAGVRCRVLSLILHIARKYTDTSPGVKSSSEKKSVINMKRALKYIMANYLNEITIEDISDEVGLSKYHFSREFKKSTGITPVNYINMLRCEKAKHMLMKESSVTEAMNASGFINASYFTKVFKKFTGQTPKEYAKKLKN